MYIKIICTVLLNSCHSIKRKVKKNVDYKIESTNLRFLQISDPAEEPISSDLIINYSVVYAFVG